MQFGMKGKGSIEILLLVKIIAAIIAVIAVGAAIHGFDLSRQEIGAQKKEKELRPQIEALQKSLTEAQAGRDTALAANKTLQGDLKTLGEERDACSKTVERLQRQGARLQAQRDARKPVDDKRLSDIDVDKRELIAALGLADKGGSCEEQLARSNALWKKIQQQRMRDFPPSATPPPKDDSSVIIKPPK